MSNFNQNDDLRILSQKTLYQGYLSIRSFCLNYRQFDGQWSLAIARELLHRSPSAVLLPYDPRLDAVIILEQFRIGAIDGPASPWLFELVAGMVEDAETPEQSAIREAKEEANLMVQAIKPVMSYWVSPGGSDERVHLYCGLVDASQAGGVYGVAEEHEEIRVHVWPVATALAKLAQGVIDNASTIIALQWLKINHESIRREWLKHLK